MGGPDEPLPLFKTDDDGLALLGTASPICVSKGVAGVEMGPRLKLLTITVGSLVGPREGQAMIQLKPDSVQCRRKTRKRTMRR